MSSSFIHVRQGDPVRISAPVWNARLDAASANRKKHNPQRVTRSAKVGQLLVRNATSSDLDAGDAVSLGAPLILPSEDEVAFFRGPGMTANLPSGSDAGGAITAEPIAPNELGWCNVSGVSTTKVNITHAAIKRCDLDVGSTLLKTTLRGSHEIIWTSSGTGEQHAIVRLGQPQSVKVAGKTSGVVNAGATDAIVRAWLSGSDSGVDINGVHFDWMEDGSISAGKEVIVTWFPDDHRWRITHAECEE